jgi:anti-anti-sigma factor
MRVSCEEHRSAVVLVLEGECTCEDVDAMRRAIHPYLERKGLSLVVDGRELQSIDSAGLEAMLQLADEIRSKSGRLCLAGFAGDARAALYLTRLERRFELKSTIEEAARCVAMGEAA